MATFTRQCIGRPPIHWHLLIEGLASLLPIRPNVSIITRELLANGWTRHRYGSRNGPRPLMWHPPHEL